MRKGSEVKVKLEKSRFGSEGRTCGFKILWGDEVRIQDEESWLEAIKASGSDRYRVGGGWCYLKNSQGNEVKFRSSNWAKNLKILHSNKWCLTSWMKRLLKNLILKVLTLVLMKNHLLMIKLCLDIVSISPLVSLGVFYCLYLTNFMIVLYYKQGGRNENSNVD